MTASTTPTRAPRRNPASTRRERVAIQDPAAPSRLIPRGFPSSLPPCARRRRSEQASAEYGAAVLRRSSSQGPGANRAPAPDRHRRYCKSLVGHSRWRAQSLQPHHQDGRTTTSRRRRQSLERAAAAIGGAPTHRTIPSPGHKMRHSAEQRLQRPTLWRRRFRDDGWLEANARIPGAALNPTDRLRS
jgi:hypothetical protein